MAENQFVFYGVRGSYSVPGIRTAKYGGNTASLLVQAGEDTIILDAGTGIINLGRDLLEQQPGRKHIDVFLTHLHMDHIQGIPFFDPVYRGDYTINFYLDKSPQLSLKEAIMALFNKPLSPIGDSGINARLNFVELDPANALPIRIGEHLSVDYIKECCHPESGVLFYRVNMGEKRLIYATDVESPQGFTQPFIDFMYGADVLIHDAMYFDEDYYCKEFPKDDYGHSTVSMACANAVSTNVKKLYLFHYNPNYSDTDVKNLLRTAKSKFKNTFLAEELKKNSV